MNSFEHVDRFLLNGLPSLRRFDMSHNSLKAVEPASFVGNPFLEHVNISKNDLSTLSPLTFGHLQRLFDLDVSYNNLSQVSVSFYLVLTHFLFNYAHFTWSETVKKVVSVTPDTFDAYNRTK